MNGKFVSKIILPRYSSELIIGANWPIVISILRMRLLRLIDRIFDVLRRIGKMWELKGSHFLIHAAHEAVSPAGQMRGGHESLGAVNITQANHNIRILFGDRAC